MQKLLVLVLLLSTFSVKAQYSEPEVKNLIATASEKDLVVQSSRFLQENFFHYADLITNRLLEINPGSGNYNYRKGFIELEMRQDYVKAINYLTKASTFSVDKNYDIYSTRESAVPADVFYHLGRAYHLDEQFEKAVENYKKFLDNTTNESELIPEAKKRILQCAVAKKLIANPTADIVKNLGETINTSFADYSSNISIDGEALYFTSRRPWEDKSSENFRDPMLNHLSDDIYQANVKIDQSWNSPYRLSLNRPQSNESTVSVSIDERKIYLYNDKNGIGDIYYTDFIDNKFTNMKPVENAKVNEGTWWETHYTVSPDGNMIFFVSDKKGGYGKRDIYYMERLNGAWTEVKNMGGNINSSSAEESPFMGLDNSMLYFSSEDSTSMGLFDIFMTVRDENGVWSTPVNLGYPINSVGDDYFYTHTSDGSKAYLTSFRKGGLGEKDIYEVKLSDPKVKNVGFLNGQIIHVKGKSIPENSYVTIKCTNCADQTANVITPRVRDGGFFYKLEKCKEYELAFYYNSSVKDPYKEKFSTNCDLAYQEVNKKVLLDDDMKMILPFFKYTVEGTVADKLSGVKIENAKVEFRIKSKNADEQMTGKNGDFVSGITKGKNFGDELKYEVFVSAEGYLNQTFELKETLGMDSIIKLSYQLVKNDEGIDIGPFIIYYDFDKHNIRPDAKVELDRVVKAMNENPTIKIELGSHTDSRGSAEYNVTLAQRRAESAAKYIQKRITTPNRLTYKGYGEGKLKNSCSDGVDCTPEEHQLNRRTEFLIQKK
jgi:outer membrane protein OmpA-like peptidoglycan-associated protein/tetratricopeptide (TPR) repeat protein